jgi:hypothetical protein
MCTVITAAVNKLSSGHRSLSPLYAFNQLNVKQGKHKYVQLNNIK